MEANRDPFAGWSEPEREKPRAEAANDNARKLHAIELPDLLVMRLPPIEMMLEPWLPTKSAAMLHSYRGVGKTYIALGLAVAVATGGAFLRWRAPRARKVLYLDGEMRTRGLYHRLLKMVAGNPETDPGNPLLRNLRLIPSDTLPPGRRLLDLNKRADQVWVESQLDGAELLILDNLSTLTRTDAENEAASWQAMQDWLMALREKGVTVLFLHHDGKGGVQRGTSRREDVLDAVMGLKHPSDYDPEEGLRVIVSNEKPRELHGKDAAPFEAQLEVVNGAAIWHTGDLDEDNAAKGKPGRKAKVTPEMFARLYNAGHREQEIREQTGISSATYFRLLRAARGLGLVKDSPEEAAA